MTDFDPTATTPLQRAVKLHAIPKEKFGVMVQKTVLGILFVGLGIWGIRLGWNVYLGIGLILFGATVWSGQIVTSTLKSLVAPVAAIRRAIGKGE